MAIKFLNTITVDNDVLYVDASANKVGIGIVSPTKTLNVEFDSSSVAVNTGGGLSGGVAGKGVLLRNSNATVGTFANLDFRANNADARIAYTHNATNNGDFHFILDNTTSVPLTRLFIEGETGNVGIGIAIPLHKLDIESDDNSLIKIRNTTNGGGASIGFNDNGTSTANQNGQITYYHSDSASQGGGSSFWLTGEDDQTLVLANNGRVVVQKTGSVSEVGYGFYDDVNTGMYRVGANHLGFATNGVSRLDITTTVATFGVSVKTPIGSAAVPALQIGDTDSGFYDSGANLISVSLGGVKSATFHNGGRFQAVSSIQAGDDTNTAEASRVGAMRYRTTTDEPVPVTGIELITNGDFATDTDWTTGTDWVISGGTANASSATANPIYQTVSGFTAGNKYRVRFEVTAVTSGQIRVYCYVGAAGTFTNLFQSTTLTTGFYEGVFEFGGTNKILRFYGGTGSNTFAGSIDNVSVVEVTEEDASYADMCMQTGASTYEWVNIVRNTY
jgi:hypothetical protein